MQRITVAPKPPLHLLPDFCRAGALLPLVLSMEAVAILVVLAGGVPLDQIGSRFLSASLFLQWIGLCSAAVLCLMRRWLRVLRPAIVLTIAWLLLLGVTLLLSEGALRISEYIQWEPARVQAPRAEFLVRTLSISAIVSLFLLRLFWVQNQWRTQIEAEGEARYQALQARMRPHFLFNSLNSIAALIETRPHQAERLIEDLSELFRVSLDVRSRLVPLREEVEVVRAYLRIEEARLGDRLQLEWDVPKHLMDSAVPLLSLQPLAENAVYHGIARLPGGGVILIRARATAGSMIIDVENPLPPQTPRAPKGLQVALDNIAQRLALIYGEQAGLELGEEVGRFRARLRIPLTTEAQGNESSHRR